MSIFTGSCVALVTPFNEQGVDFEKLTELIEFHIANQTDAILVCGTTGEASTQPDAEHISVMKFAVEKINKRVPVIVGTGSNDTAHAIELNKAAEEIGADAVLMVTPYYNKTTQKGLYEHFKTIANATSLPIILYTVPSRTGMNMTPATVAKLAEIDNIAAIKEASGDITQIAKIAALCGDKLDIYSGNDDQVLPILALGGKGVISTMANIIPKDTHDLVLSFLEGDIEKSRKLQLQLLELIDALFIETNPIPVKTALNLLGFSVGPCRMPLTDMEDKNLEFLKTALKNYGLLK